MRIWEVISVINHHTYVLGGWSQKKSFVYEYQTKLCSHRRWTSSPLIITMTFSGATKNEKSEVKLQRRLNKLNMVAMTFAILKWLYPCLPLIHNLNYCIAPGSLSLVVLASSFLPVDQSPYYTVLYSASHAISVLLPAWESLPPSGQLQEGNTTMPIASLLTPGKSPCRSVLVGPVLQDGLL